MSIISGGGTLHGFQRPLPQARPEPTQNGAAKEYQADWGVRLSPDAHVILSFRLPEGAEMSFRLSHSALREMRDALTVIAENAAPVHLQASQ